jgi:hypothetical protein
MGATIGVLVVRRVERLIDSLTPRSIAVRTVGRLRELADQMAAFTADVREAAAEREVELRRASLRAVPPSAA